MGLGDFDPFDFGQESSSTGTGHSYRKVVDDGDQLQYEHPDGETFIVANKQRDGSWRIVARGGGQRERVGTEPTKSDARRRMTRWMTNHPDGLGFGFGLGF